ncbi:MAG: DegT/DnrJ/EryC1/StrS family aminotransferase, partial [Deltaproteobacteria bacterium]|nr:DegT/DnrJ/EryC1/StrS family aminotransferase [Deltaproteobacteria bacterium]
AYFTIFIGPQARRNRDQVLEGLQEIGIQSRKMFFPPAHAHQAFRTRPSRIVGDLSNTWAASLSSLALPLYSHMTDETLHRVCDAVRFLLGAKT